MSHLVIVGGSTGIGRDIQAPLRMCGHMVTALRREQQAAFDATGILFCQRNRGRNSGSTGLDDFTDEVEASLERTQRVLIGRRKELRSVVILASVAGVSVEDEQPVSYHACKSALIEMTKYYAVRFGPEQIRVNAIIPGLTIKPEARAFYDAHPELEATYKDITPLGRMGTVEDLAHLVDFLISDKSSYLTGQTITLDGGIGLRSAWALARRVSPALRDLQVTQRKAAK